MTTYNIIELALEAASGMLSYDAEGNWRLGEKEVERFATLVRTAALEEAAKACEKLDEEASHKEDRLAAGRECASAIRAMKVRS